MDVPPDEVAELAERRATARRERDFSTADQIRDRIAALGWHVRDTGHDYELSPASTRLAVRPVPSYRVLPALAALPDRSAEPDIGRAVVALLVEGWPEDLHACVHALMSHRPTGVSVIALDAGNVDGAGDTLDELARTHPDGMEAWHVAEPVRWGVGREALLRASTAPVHVVMDTSTLLHGDALSPLLGCLEDPRVVGAGWRGVAPDEDWLSFHDVGSGAVPALLGYLFAVRRSAALQVGFPAQARFYRNADLEFSLALRAAGLGSLVVPDWPLPVSQGRHRGYRDTEPVYRDRESKRNYERLLRRFRGREDLRVP